MICEKKSRDKYVGGFKKLKNDIFSKLEQIGIFVPKMDRFYDYFAVFDAEALLPECSEKQTENLKYTRIHKPISIAVCSNVFSWR